MAKALLAYCITPAFVLGLRDFFYLQWDVASLQLMTAYPEKHQILIWNVFQNRTLITNN